MQHSPQQVAIVDHVVSAPESLIVDAVAGSGKTTTILEAAIRCGAPTVLLCAFNKRIADELTERLQRVRLPRGRMIKAQTLHSIGYEIIRHHEPRTTVDRDATDELVKEVAPSLPFKGKRAVVKAVRYLKETCIEYETASDIEKIVKQQGIDEVAGLATSSADVALAAFEAMARSSERRPSIDFCDMVWRPYALEMPPKGRYKMVFVDEAQDMTPGQFSMVVRLLAPGGRIVTVGDLNQEIYDWKGAAGPRIWERMRDEFKAKELPLTWSFRCAKTIVQQANVLVPEITAAPDAEPGVVDSMRLKAALDAIEVGDFFLSRTNSGAVTSAIRASLRGKLVRVFGTFDDLDPLIDLIKKFNTRTSVAFLRDLGEWETKQLARDDLTDAQADQISDRAKLLGEAAKLIAPDQIPKALRAVFRTEGPAAMFSTVHKAKGLEADRVFLLRETFLRHRPKRDGTRRKLEDLPVEERNIEYVAITRARKHLTWVLPDFVEAYEGDPVRRAPTLQELADDIHAFPSPLDDDQVVKDALDLGIPIDFPEEEP